MAMFAQFYDSNRYYGSVLFIGLANIIAFKIYLNKTLKIGWQTCTLQNYETLMEENTADINKW